MNDFPPIDLHDLLVPLRSAVAVDVGPIDRSSLSRLEANGYDQAPVRCDGEWIGLIATTHLRSLADSDEALRIGDTALSAHIVRDEDIITIADLLGALSDDRAVLVTRHDTGPFGFITLSDLNRHALRKALYDLLSEVESRLATLLDRNVADLLSAIDDLSESNQMRLLGHYHYMKRKGLDLSPLAGATLTQLIDLAQRQPDILKLLGYSKTKFKADFGSISDLRNSVMHPVRPLVHSQKDVASTLDRVVRIAELRNRLRSTSQAVPGTPLL